MTGQYPLLVDLLLDEALRERFRVDRAAVLRERGLTGDAAAAFAQVAVAGLNIDAEGRQRYLMTDLCRSHPRTAAVIGACAGGRAALLSFLREDALRLAPQERNIAFGAFLDGLLDSLLPETLGPEAVPFFRAFLTMERRIEANAAALRAALRQAGTPPPPALRPRPMGPDLLQRFAIALPPFFLCVPLPCARDLLLAALDGVTPEHVWRWIDRHDLSPDRLRSLLRAQPDPMLLIGRAVPQSGGQTGHILVELAGLTPDDLQLLVGRTLREIPPPLRPLAQMLGEGGLLIPAPA